jgi:hypothetical protein
MPDGFLRDSFGIAQGFLQDSFEYEFLRDF